MTTKKLATLWTKGALPADKPNIEQAIRAATVPLSILRQIIQEKLDAIETAEVKDTVYDNTEWAYKQAHFNGRKQALRELRELLSFLP